MKRLAVVIVVDDQLSDDAVASIEREVARHARTHAENATWEHNEWNRTTLAKPTVYVLRPPCQTVPVRVQ